MVKPCSRNKNSPLVRLQNKYERYGTENNVLSGRGLARRPLSARRVHIKMTSHVAQCIHNTSYCAARELCRLQIWTKRYREHFTVLVIWTLVYREHVPRTFCQGFVPRTYMNGLSGFKSYITHCYASQVPGSSMMYELLFLDCTGRYVSLRLNFFSDIQGVLCESAY